METASHVTEKLNMTVVRAFNILELLNTRGSPITIAEICRELSLNRITCTNLVKTLISKKYLYKNEKGMVCLSGKIFVMGEIFREGFPVVELFHSYASELSVQLNCKSHLVTFAGLNQGLLLSQIPRPTIYEDTLQLYVPLYCTGAGKVLLANQSREIIAQIVSSLDMRAYTDNTITDKAALYDELDKIRENGYGVDNCEFMPGLYCISAPIINMDGSVNTAVTLSKLKIDAETGFEYYTPHVLRLSRTLSHISGRSSLTLNSL